MVRGWAPLRKFYLKVQTKATEACHLAGTRLKNATRWGNKELEEQKFVTKEVHRSLKAFGGKISRDKQTTFNAGPVEHLTYLGKYDNQTLDSKSLAEELHPTPAICGSPAEIAQELIAQYEGYDRSLIRRVFGGFLNNKYTQLYY